MESCNLAKADDDNFITYTRLRNRMRETILTWRTLQGDI